LDLRFDDFRFCTIFFPLKEILYPYC